MSSLIYFPNFEPQNEKWLKFSLLYLDEFRPIIPDTRRDDVSDSYKLIMGETDLIEPYSPEYMHGENAGIRSIEEIEKMLANPERYQTKFENFPDKWKDQSQWNYFIYEEKYSYQFKRFCVENKIAKQIENGITLSEEVGYIFMKNLATEISNQTDSSIITDSQKFQNYDTFTDQHNNYNETSKLAESVISLKMPAYINYVDFNKIIEFRNKNRELIKEFQSAIEKIKRNPNDLSALEFLGEFDKVYSKSIPKIVMATLATSIIPLSIYSYFDNTSASNIDALKVTAETAVGLLGTSYSIKEIISETNNKRQCIKYLANLKELY